MNDGLPVQTAKPAEVENAYKATDSLVTASRKKLLEPVPEAAAATENAPPPGEQQREQPKSAFKSREVDHVHEKSSEHCGLCKKKTENVKK